MITTCPKCQSPSTRLNGKTRAGSQRRRCNDCGRSWTGGLHGSLPIGETAQTRSDESKLYRAKLKLRKAGILP